MLPPASGDIIASTVPKEFSVSKFAIGEQVENVADDHDQSAAVAAFPAVGGSTPRALDTEGYAATIENIRAAVSGKAPPAATKRSPSPPPPHPSNPTTPNRNT